MILKKPIIHFITNNNEMLIEMNKIFFNHKNIVINDDSIFDMESNNIIFVSFTSCIIGQPTIIDTLYLNKFNHENILTEEINKLTKYSNTDIPYIPYNSLINISINNTHILYIPIRFSITSNIPINHIHNAITTIFDVYINTNYDVEKIVIPLDGIQNYKEYNINHCIIAKLLYDGYIYNIKRLSQI